MPTELIVRLLAGRIKHHLTASLLAVGEDSSPTIDHTQHPGPKALLTGDRSYLVSIPEPVSEPIYNALKLNLGKSVHVIFPGRKPVRRRLTQIAGFEPETALPALPGSAPPTAVDLREGRSTETPLWLWPDGTFHTHAPGTNSPAAHAAPSAQNDLLQHHQALISAARWISSRRQSTFECLFPQSAFHPDKSARPERLSAPQAQGLLLQCIQALRTASPSGEPAARDPKAAAQIRSATLTILSHLVATVLRDASFRPIADQAAEQIFSLIEAEQNHPASIPSMPALRAHAISLLQMRGPALSPAHAKQARALVQSLLRQSPPYDELQGPYRFAMCSAWDFHEGECDILVNTYGFRPVPTPPDAPPAPAGEQYHVFEAPFKSPSGQPILIFARTALPQNENIEMGQSYFIGILINRHAQLGAYDMRAAKEHIQQQGYKLMMNSQCAGLTTRFTMTRLFPDADIYSSWDSTYFRTSQDEEKKVIASEGVDCFIALLQGMSQKESHAELEARIRKAQWHHAAADAISNYVQFVGPSNPIVVKRFSDINQDGRADFYDGFLDFYLSDIAEDIYSSLKPKDPGVHASQIGGKAADGLNWAAGSLNRVAQYSDVWSMLPGESELLYVYQSAGFYNAIDLPSDIPLGKNPVPADIGRLPAVCRYQKSPHSASGLLCEVMFHGHLSHSAKELKRLLCAAEAFWRAVDLGHLPERSVLSTRIGQRAALLLTLAGLLEFPADQNFIDGLWSMALSALNFPDISRSTVRACITDEDHDASNYYGSVRGVRQLIGRPGAPGALENADALVYERLKSEDPRIGRANELVLP